MIHQIKNSSVRIFKQKQSITFFDIYDDMIESEFPDYIKQKLGFNCIKFNGMKNISFARTFLKAPIFESLEIGNPDFFIWKGKEHYFCEFKSKNDVLSSYQIQWIILNDHLPFAVAKVHNFGKLDAVLGLPAKRAEVADIKDANKE